MHYSVLFSFRVVKTLRVGAYPSL